jgi:hypothetical protein
MVRVLRLRSRTFASIAFGDEIFSLPNVEDRKIANMVGEKLDDIRRGRMVDPYGWMVPVG